MLLMSESQMAFWKTKRPFASYLRLALSSTGRHRPEVITADRSSDAYKRAIPCASEAGATSLACKRRRLELAV
jgi:hypothetical protein